MATPRATATRSGPKTAAQRRSLTGRLRAKYPWPHESRAAARAPVAPDEFFADIQPSCQSDRALASADAFVGNFSDEPTTVNYQVTSAAGAVAGTGQLNVPAGDSVDFILDGLAAGTYRITFTNEEGGSAILTLDFRVLGCITATVSCGAVAFTNPATNPQLTLLYGNIRADEPDGVSTLAPGESQIVATPRTRLTYLAVFLDEDAGQLSIAGSEIDLPVPNGPCRISITETSTKCAEATGGDGAARATVDIAAGQEIRYTVRRAGRSRVVARSDSAARDKDRKDTVRFDDLKAGRYVLRAYVGNEDDPTDRARFTVADCEPAPVAPGGGEPPATGGGGEHLAATGGASPLVFVGGLLAFGGGVLLLRRRPL